MSESRLTRSYFVVTDAYGKLTSTEFSKMSKNRLIRSHFSVTDAAGKLPSVL